MQWLLTCAGNLEQVLYSARRSKCPCAYAAVRFRKAGEAHALRIPQPKFFKLKLIRFAFVTEEQINLLVDKAVPENTKNVKSYAVTFIMIRCS